MYNQNLTALNNKTGIYIRLSQEDRNKKIEQASESVNNQKLVLTKYCENNNLEIIDYYIDDGYTGTNFDRPGFNRLLEDIDRKKVDTILVKDLSRLGREYIKTGEFLEITFPDKNIRIISMQEGMDTASNNCYDYTAMMLVFYDQYSRQNSNKIKSVLDTKRGAGHFIGSKPSYGYMRDPNNKALLIPDPEVADNVKLIFDLRLNNMGLSAIATRLTQEGIPTPSSYKKIPKSSRLKNPDTWTISSVRKILQNEMYIGDMVQHKQAKPSYKSRKKRTLPREQWIIVNDTHEPLIDKETFKIVNQKSKRRERAVNPKTDRPIRLFEGLLYCVECGNKLGVTYKKNKDYWSVNCNKYARDPVRGMCYSHFFPYDKLEESILKELDGLLSKLFSYVDINELNQAIINNNNLNSDNHEIKKSKCENEISKINNALQIAYQDRVEGNISIDQYKLIMSPFQEKLNALTAEIERIEIEIIKNKQSTAKIPDYSKNIKKLLNSKNPNRDLILALIEKIYIDKDRNVNIKFRYDLLEKHTFQYVDITPIRNPYGRTGKVKN